MARPLNAQSFRVDVQDEDRANERTDAAPGTPGAWLLATIVLLTILALGAIRLLS